MFNLFLLSEVFIESTKISTAFLEKFSKEIMVIFKKILNSKRTKLSSIIDYAIGISKKYESKEAICTEVKKLI